MTNLDEFYTRFVYAFDEMDNLLSNCLTESYVIKKVRMNYAYIVLRLDNLVHLFIFFFSDFSLCKSQFENIDRILFTIIICFNRISNYLTTIPMSNIFRLTLLYFDKYLVEFSGPLSYCFSAY